MTIPAFGWLLLPLLSGVIAFGVVWLIGRFAPARAPVTAPGAADPGTARFLFTAGVLSDHDLSERHLPPGLTDWAALRAWLAFRFPDLPETPDDTPDHAAGSRLTLRSVLPDDSATLCLQQIGSACHITLHDPAPGDFGENHDRRRLGTRLGNWDSALRNAPFGLCISDGAGHARWDNTFFATLPAATRARLLPDADKVGHDGTTLTERISVEGDGRSPPRWFEVGSARIGADLFHHVTDITKVVQADTVRREFVQTLTKTFANLTTGLAVFDRNHRLALFNPALVDLTGLGAEFLSAQPDLISVFDNLRDRQVMPEPKNYANWRTEIGKMVATASGGFFQDTWTLPSGLTFRVTGRPHPDGAIAFLFEDISDEVSLTRRFRAQLDLRHAVLENLNEAVAVISSNNLLLLCNARCSALLGVDPDESLAEISTASFIRICADVLPQDGFWSEVETRLHDHALSAPMETVIQHGAGPDTLCRLVPLPGGATLLTLAAKPLGLTLSRRHKAAG
ncbi:MAG TPA: PAS-domain containing protein [Roseovarius sp.]|nr:PAS-domain containing protein [Roseovarius sp.]